jgi:hypothetical protein
MTAAWHPPVPHHVTDTEGRPWLVRRAWPGDGAGHYILEVQAPGRQDVHAGQIRQGLYEQVFLHDPWLPSLAEEAAKGTTVVHRAHKRAVVKAGQQYIKIFRPGRAAGSADRHNLAAGMVFGYFDTPAIHEVKTDSIAFSALPGRSFFDLGQDHREVTDAAFARHWARWSRAWVATLSRSGSTDRHGADALPARPASTEAEILRRWVNHWLRHSAGVPEAAQVRSALEQRAEDVIGALLATAADPLGWAHGDLHDKQLLGTGRAGTPGLLDFDETCQAEAALDLANLDVHLALRHRQRRLTPRRYAIAHHHILATAKRLHVSPGRFAAYTDSTRLRLACLYSFRPPWGPRAADYLTSTFINPTAGPAPSPEPTTGA